MNYPFVAGEAVTTARVNYLLPAFSYAVTWSGVSDLLATYPLNNEQTVSLVLPIDAPSETFVLAVAWSDGTETYRFKIFGEGVLHYPVYNGEAIGTDGRLEVWSASVSNASMTEDLQLETSLLLEATDDCYNETCDLPTSVIELEAGDDAAEEPEFEEEIMLAVQGSAELRTLSHVADQFRYLDFLDAEGDGRGGEFIYDSASSVADDGADYIKPDDVSALSPGRWVRTSNP